MIPKKDARLQYISEELFVINLTKKNRKKAIPSPSQIDNILPLFWIQLGLPFWNPIN